ncbi:MAG: ParB/RepB/Spo0J family partition protein [Deltaproteobacteria bacterium]
MTDENSKIPRRPALGRGLAALIPQAQSPGPSSQGLLQLAIERVSPDQTQPRRHFDDGALDELAASIRERGVLQPILVRRSGSAYQIVAGERRWRAAQRAGLHEVPALVKDLGDQAAFEVALIENVQRQDLDPLEEAMAYQRLTEEHGLTQEEVAKRVGKDRSTVANSMRLLRLPPSVRAAIGEGALSMGHARALLAIEDAAKLERVAREAIAERLSVREVERRARQEKARAIGAPAPAPAGFKAIERGLERALGTRVKIASDGTTGQIVVHFSSVDEFERLRALLEQKGPRPTEAGRA